MLMQAGRIWYHPTTKEAHHAVILSIFLLENFGIGFNIDLDGRVSLILLVLSLHFEWGEAAIDSIIK